MNKRKILIFAGTTEGRHLVEYLQKYAVRLHVCVATPYGERLLKASENISVSHERMDAHQMSALMQNFLPDYVVDATHPYADEVTKNIRAACDACKCSYLRLVREKMSGEGLVTYVTSTDEAVAVLQKTEGNILVTTGSKELKAYTQLENYKERVYARVLSVKSSVEQCEASGIEGKHLICMQGPFSVEMNRVILKDYQISWMVTKESGRSGGFLEKYEACQQMGTKMLVIGRPDEDEGLSYHEMCRYFREQLNLTPSYKVTLVGIGLGSQAFMTEAAKKACEEANVCIGAKRMLGVVPQGKKTVCMYKTEEILRWLFEHPEYDNAAVLFSGDIGFYSGAKKLREQLENEENVEVRVISGISSGIYLCNRLGISWEDVRFLSMHGRALPLISYVRTNEKLVILTENADKIRAMMKTLVSYGYGALKTAIGCRLGYADEKISAGTAADFCEYSGDALAVIYLENVRASKSLRLGIPEDTWIRGKVPMTKEEVRCVSISKMRLGQKMTVYDIGAGTGSVSVEAALQIPDGRVYAIEQKAEAIELIEKNKQKFGADTLEIISGKAPEAIRTLPPPDVVFIGGSGGQMKEILKLVLQKNPRVRVVINAIALETVAEVLAFFEETKPKMCEVIQLQVSKGKIAGAYHMMMGQNPVYIITCSWNGEEE